MGFGPTRVSPQGPEPCAFTSFATRRWSSRRDSNPHALRQRILNPPRLPFSHWTLVLQAGLEPATKLLLRQRTLPIGLPERKELAERPGLEPGRDLSATAS